MLSNKLNNVGIDPELDERLDRLAARQRRPKEFILDEVLGEYVYREEQLAAERDEIQRRIDEYERTGLHVTHEEVVAWLERRAKGENVPPPECHT